MPVKAVKASRSGLPQEESVWVWRCCFCRNYNWSHTLTDVQCAHDKVCGEVHAQVEDRCIVRYLVTREEYRVGYERRVDGKVLAKTENRSRATADAIRERRYVEKEKRCPRCLRRFNREVVCACGRDLLALKPGPNDMTDVLPASASGVASARGDIR